MCRLACLSVPYYIITSGLSAGTILFCHLWPVCLYHIILPSVACLPVPYYINICGLSACTIVYYRLWPVCLYHIILPSVACLLVPYYITICGNCGRYCSPFKDSNTNLQFLRYICMVELGFQLSHHKINSKAILVFSDWNTAPITALGFTVSLEIVTKSMAIV